MSCLNTIISVNDGCTTETSLSGRDIFDLPGLTIKQAAGIASEKFVSGINLLKDARRRAILDIKEDLLKFLRGNGYVPNLVSSTWTTLSKRDGSIKVATNLGDYRGIVIKKKNKNCGLQKMYIPYIYVKADHTGSLTLNIDDGETSYPYTFDSVSGSISKVKVSFLAETDEVHILLPDSVDVYSVEPNCQCSGTMQKSSDFIMRGYYNGVETKSEGFGIWADVQTKCDYEKLLCLLTTEGLLGSVVLYKAGVNIMDERLKTDRLNYFTIYGDEEAAQTKDEWTQIYNENWNTLIAALPGFIKTVDKCGCIECGSGRKANI